MKYILFAVAFFVMACHGALAGVAFPPATSSSGSTTTAYQNLATNRAPSFSDDSTKLYDSTHGVTWKDGTNQLWTNASNGANAAVWIPVTTPPNTYPCDAAGGCYTAYGVKLLVSSYAGSCMDIKRASDSTSKTLGYVGGVCDFATGDTFCANTSCTITKWYNQTANTGHDCVPYTAAAQPAYPTVALKGLRGVVMDGQYQKQIASGTSKSCSDSAFSATSQALSMFFVGKMDQQSATSMMAASNGLLQYELQGSGNFRHQLYYNSGSAAGIQGAVSSSPSVFGFVSGATASLLYNDDRGALSGTAASSSYTITPMAYFNNVASETSYNGFSGTIWAWMSFTSALSSGTATQLQQNLYTQFPVTPQLRNQFVAVGDSLTEGIGAQNELTYTELLGRALPNPVRIVNVGTAGQYCTYFSASGGGATNHFDNAFSNGSRNTIALWCGTNDIAAGGYTPAQAYANLQGAISYIRSKDPTDPLLVFTMISRSGVTDSTRTSFNSFVRAGFSSGSNGTSCGNATTCAANGLTPLCTAGANCQGNIYLVDVGNDAVLGQAGSYANSTYFFSDGTHLTSTGYAAVVSDIMNTLSSYNLTP